MNNMPVRSTLGPGQQTPTTDSLDNALATNNSPYQANPTADHFKNKTNNLEELERVQDDLQETRDVALGARYDLQLQRTRLRNTRQQAGSAEAAFMEQLRHYFLGHGLAMPSNIMESYNRMKEMREHLGVADEEYFEAEENYNALEWSMAQKEVKFLEKLADPQPSETVSCQSMEVTNRSMGLEDLTRHADGLHGTSSHLPIMTPDNTQQKDKSAEGHNSGVGADLRAHITRPSSVQPLYGSGTEQPTLVPSIAYSESARYDLSWSDTRDRIDVWILNSVVESHLEKTRLKQYVDPVVLKGLGDQEWWQLVVKHWNANNRKIVTKPVVEESSTRFGIAGTEGLMGAYSFGGARPHLSMSTVDARSVVPEASLPFHVSPLEEGTEERFATAKPETPQSSRTEPYIPSTWIIQDGRRSDSPVRADAPLGQYRKLDPDRAVPVEAVDLPTTNSGNNTIDNRRQDPTHVVKQNMDDGVHDSRPVSNSLKNFRFTALPKQDFRPERSLARRDTEHDRTSIRAFHARARSDSPQNLFKDDPALPARAFTMGARPRAVASLTP